MAAFTPATRHDFALAVPFRVGCDRLPVPASEEFDEFWSTHRVHALVAERGLLGQQSRLSVTLSNTHRHQCQPSQKCHASVVE